MATRKQYKFIEVVNGFRTYEEDSSGRNVGGIQVDQFGNNYKCVVCKIDIIDLDNGRAGVTFADFVNPSGTSDWSQKPDIKTDINDSKYRYATIGQSNFGQVELVPFEDDTTKPIVGTDPVQYEKKLKDGLITEAQFFYNMIFLGMYPGVATNDLLYQTILEEKGWSQS